MMLRCAGGWNCCPTRARATRIEPATSTCRQGPRCCTWGRRPIGRATCANTISLLRLFVSYRLCVETWATTREPTDGIRNRTARQQADECSLGCLLPGVWHVVALVPAPLCPGRDQ